MNAFPEATNPQHRRGDPLHHLGADAGHQAPSSLGVA
jgi:hypothetical protein